MKKTNLVLLCVLFFGVLGAQPLNWVIQSGSPTINGSSVKYTGAAISIEAIKPCTDRDICFILEEDISAPRIMNFGVSDENTPGQPFYGFSIQSFFMSAQVQSQVFPLGPTAVGWTFLPSAPTVNTGDELCLRIIGGEVKFLINGAEVATINSNNSNPIGANNLVAFYNNNGGGGVLMADAKSLDVCGQRELWVRSGLDKIRPVSLDDHVGIGVDPTAKLDVDGDLRVRGIEYNASLKKYLVKNDNGNVYFNEGQNLSEVLANGNDAGGMQILNLADPTGLNDGATKQYVDNAILSSQDNDWHIESTNQTPFSTSNNIYTNGEVGINRVGNLNAALHLEFDYDWVPGEWGAIFDAGSICRDVVTVQMAEGCDYSTAYRVEQGGVATASIFANGWANAAGDWIMSDRRFKSNIKAVRNPLEIINKLNGKTYDFKVTENSDPVQSRGFIAQEAKGVVPDLVKKMPNGRFAVNYDGFIPILTEAIKEQQTQITEQSNEIVTLKQQVVDLINTVEQIKKEVNTTGPKELKNPNHGLILPDDLNKAWLGQNFPNPNNGVTSIKYNIPLNSKKAELTILNVEGKVLQTMILSPKEIQVDLDLSQLSSGDYIYSLTIDGYRIDSKQMVIHN